MADTSRHPQIGLTALAYEKCYPLLKPSMKIDQARRLPSEPCVCLMSLFSSGLDACTLS
jgi:hypothetical protein